MGPAARETHISTILFTADRAFKLLKPVDSGFVDHRTVEARLEAADREVELNRRFAPDVYLGTADVIENGDLVDRMIVMRRLPADRSLTSIIARGELTDDHLRSTARTVATVHAGLPPIHEEDGPGSRAVQRQNWEDSFAQIADYIGPVLDEGDDWRIVDLTRRYLNGRAELFDQRVTAGHVRDGHGDLLADDIFVLDDGPRILDCLAFRDDLRISDVLSDIGFLAMDLHRLAGPEPATTLLRYYREFSGEVHPSSLAHHYVAYRAHVRCKVSCLRWQQGAQEFGAVARMYHRMTLDQLERARPRIVLVGGGPGTGKTSVASTIGDHFGWPVVSSDEIRKDRARVDPGEHRVAQPDQGLYTPDLTAQTYDELIGQTRALVASGHCAVLDASWTDASHRERVRRLADELSTDLVEIECAVDKSVARERVARRLADGWNPSDATPEIVDHLAGQRDPWPAATTIDTSASPETTTASVLALLSGGPASTLP